MVINVAVGDSIEGIANNLWDGFRGIVTALNRPFGCSVLFMRVPDNRGQTPFDKELRLPLSVVETFFNRIPIVGSSLLYGNGAVEWTTVQSVPKSNAAPTCKCRGGGFYGHDSGCPMEGYYSGKAKRTLE